MKTLAIILLILSTFQVHAQAGLIPLLPIFVKAYVDSSKDSTSQLNEAQPKESNLQMLQRVAQRREAYVPVEGATHEEILAGCHAKYDRVLMGNKYPSPKCNQYE